MLKKPIVREVLRYFPIAFGCAIYALGFDLFYKPNDIVPGGVSGIAMILNSLIGKPSVGSLILIINIPLFIAGFIVLGKRFIAGTVFGTVVSSILIDVFAQLPKFMVTEPILAAIYGGLFSGFGLGIVFYFEGTTGGVDIVASLVRLRRPSAKMGQLILVTDAIVVIAAAIVFDSLGAALYAIIAFYVSSIVTDTILYGSQNARIAYIICRDPDGLAAEINAHLLRGVTFLHGKGAYTGQEREILLCAVKRRQVTQLKKIVHDFDKDAFLILCSANEVLGNGFTSQGV